MFLITISITIIIIIFIILKYYEKLNSEEKNYGTNKKIEFFNYIKWILSNKELKNDVKRIEKKSFDINFIFLWIMIKILKIYKKDMKISKIFKKYLCLKKLMIY